MSSPISHPFPILDHGLNPRINIRTRMGIMIQELLVCGCSGATSPAFGKGRGSGSLVGCWRVLEGVGGRHSFDSRASILVRTGMYVQRMNTFLQKTPLVSSVKCRFQVEGPRYISLICVYVKSSPQAKLRLTSAFATSISKVNTASVTGPN